MLLGQLRQIAMDSVWVATVRAHLNRHMLDAEIAGHTCADGSKQFVGESRVVSIDQHVTGHHDEARLNCPDMQIVDILDARDRFDCHSHV